ncbi:ATP-binding protein, partial [Acinetobacter baumannii]
GDLRQPGSGLGLAIVRQICEAHGGRVLLEDGPEGRGLRVRIELPAASVPGIASPGPTPTLPRKANGPR